MIRVEGHPEMTTTRMTATIRPAMGLRETTMATTTHPVVAHLTMTTTVETATTGRAPVQPWTA